MRQSTTHSAVPMQWPQDRLISADHNPDHVHGKLVGGSGLLSRWKQGATPHVTDPGIINPPWISNACYQPHVTAGHDVMASVEPTVAAPPHIPPPAASLPKVDMPAVGDHHHNLDGQQSPSLSNPSCAE